MTSDEFSLYGKRLIDEITDYFKSFGRYPVKSQSKPGDIYNRLPASPPVHKEKFEQIIHDFHEVIMPGITHWQHPRFFAYFPANNSFPSILGEMLTSAIAAQCMIWQTSPAAAELEEMMMNWLRQMIGLSDKFTGVIQDTASTATLCSILTAREKYSEYKINSEGFSDNYKFRVYCSTETHSSIEKAVKIAGIGKNNLIKIRVNENFEMDIYSLENAIVEDLKNNFIPLCVVGTLGTTGSTSIDPLEKTGILAKKYNIWYHIDAAFAGTALILPEYRGLVNGIEYADTFVFNPHKWMFTNFDCSAYFVKDKNALTKTFEIMPEYLKTDEDKFVNNYRDWGIQLGRRFRALKLWFVIRAFGVEGIQQKLREHIRIAKIAKEYLEESDDFEIMSKVNFNALCFRFNPFSKRTNIEKWMNIKKDSVINSGDIIQQSEINSINKQLLENLNKTGKVFFTHTKLNENFVIRWVIGQTNVTENDIKFTWELIKIEAEKLKV